MLGLIKSFPLWHPAKAGQHSGLPYRDFLRLAHEAIQPVSYLEIGVKAGKSFQLAQCPAVGIDPCFRPDANSDLIGRRTETYLFQCTSDHFFATFSLKHFLPMGVDFAFLDGMHLFEFLLRDFMNTEKHARHGAVIALHDCHPTNAPKADRDRAAYKAQHRSGGWAGDVWKVLPVLQRYRPDLGIAAFDCPPTGLALVTGLDPSSRSLADAYDRIVAETLPLTLAEFGLERFQEQFPVLDSRRYAAEGGLRRLLRPPRPGPRRP